MKKHLWALVMALALGCSTVQRWFAGSTVAASVQDTPEGEKFAVSLSLGQAMGGQPLLALKRADTSTAGLSADALLTYHVAPHPGSVCTCP